MEAQIIDRSSNAVHEVGDYHKYDMDKCSEAESAEDWDRAGRFDGHMDGQDLLAYIHDTQDFLEDMEGRLLVSAMVADAVTNGMVNAVLEESSEALAGKETEIVALNDKLEGMDAKMWSLEETLRHTQKELASHIAESRSDRDRLVMDFMHEKNRMQRKMHERTVCLEEKDKQLAWMEMKLETEENRISAMEQQLRILREADSSNRSEISALVEELKGTKVQKETDHSLVREETLQNEDIENLQRVITEKNERIGFLECSISEKDKTIMSLEERNSLQLQNLKNLELALREESEGQILRQEIERCVVNIIYEGQLLELRDVLETDRLQSRTVILTPYSAVDNINSIFLDMTLKLDDFEKTSKMFFQHIHSQIALFQEEHLEQQWKYDFEEETSELVLRESLKNLEGQLKIKEQEERKPSMLQVRWDEGRVALVSELNHLRQELELLKIEEPVKSPVNSDGGNSNGFQYFCQLTQEVKNGESPDGKRKDQSLRRFSAGQLSADTSKLEDNSYTTVPTGKNAGHYSKEPDLSGHTHTEMADILESPLKSMSKEQLTAHYKRVVAELKRENECIVGKKTEEIYKLKSELLREKGSLHSKKDKELNVSKKRIAEITGKLVNLVENNDKLFLAVVEDQNSKMFCKLKDEMQVEKIRLLEKVTEKEIELKALSDKLSDALRKDTEYCLLNQIAELESEKAEMDIITLNTIDILRTLFEETVKEREISMGLALKERDHFMREKISLEELLHEKDRLLKLVDKEKEGHMQQIALQEKMLKEKENALEECEDLKKQKLSLENAILGKNGIVESVMKEQEELKEEILSIKKAREENETALIMASRDLEEARKEKEVLEGIIKEKENTLYLFTKKEEVQKKQFEAITAEKENACTAAARNIKEHKETIISLEKKLEEKELSFELSVKGKEEELQQKYLLQAKVQELKMAVKNMQMHTKTIEKQNRIEVAESVKKCMDASLALERRVMEKMQENVSRLEQNKQQLKKLQGQVDALVLRESYYKQKLERKCCNLQKAEKEVDLLGDEVDALLSLLEKIYAALDHYSPVLQHYPGILDLLKLVKRELIDHVDSGLQI